MAVPVRDKPEAMQRIRLLQHELVSLGVKSIGLFGSFVKGSQTATSDVDLLVVAPSTQPQWIR